MVNINIIIPDDLHKKLRLQSAIDEKSIKELILNYLKKSIKEKSRGKK